MFIVERNPNGTVSISQPGYLKKLFDKHGINESSKVYEVPMDPKFDDDDQDDSEPFDEHQYVILILFLIFVIYIILLIN